MSNLASLFDRYKALVIFDTETSGPARTTGRRQRKEQNHEDCLL